MFSLSSLLMCSFLATATQCCIHGSQSTVCALADSGRKSSAAAQASHPMGLYIPCKPVAVPQPHRVHDGTAAHMDGRTGRVCCSGFAHRSVLGARPTHGVEDSDAAWEHTTCAWSQHSQRAVGERGMGWGAGADQSIPINWWIFSVWPVHLNGYSVLSKFFAKEVKWREKKKRNGPCF